MCAHMRVNVVYVKFSISSSVECPGAVVAHHPPCPVWRGGGGLGWLGGAVSGGVAGTVACAFQPVSWGNIGKFILMLCSKLLTLKIGGLISEIPARG